VEIPVGTNGPLLSMKSNGDCWRCELPEHVPGYDDKVSDDDHDVYTMSAGAVFSQLLRTPIDPEVVNRTWGDRPAFYWELDDDTDIGIDVLYCSEHHRYLPCRYCDPGGDHAHSRT
jgi:hypothetical protein